MADDTYVVYLAVNWKCFVLHLVFDYISREKSRVFIVDSTVLAYLLTQEEVSRRQVQLQLI